MNYFFYSVVTCISLLPWNDQVLVSGGGDGTIRLWDFVKGKQIQSVDLKAQIEAYKPPVADANSEDAIISALAFDNTTQSLAVAFAKSPAVLVLKYDENQFTYKETVVVSSPILDIAFDLQGKLWFALDGEQLVTVASQKDGQLVENKDDAVVKQINATEVCQAAKIPDLYTIFGLRKFLDLPENLAEESEKKSKKRKTE
jgi:WD40 repeat protein